MRSILIVIGILLSGAGGAARARAALIADPVGDFLSTYTGPQDAGLDVVAHEVTLVGDRLNFFGRMAGPVAPTQAFGGVYLFGVDRGLGTPRFTNTPPAPPVIGPGVVWDVIIRVSANGTGSYLNNLAGTTTALDPADISISSNELTASVPISLMLPGSTRPAAEWTYNLWPRNGAGSNVQVSDLAPDNSNSPVHVVPEPASLLLCAMSGLGLLGRHRRRKTRRFAVNHQC